MARFLAYVEPVPGRLYPLVATLQELVRRGHVVSVRSGVDAVILDETSWGAAAVAERSGLPWAFSVPSPLPIPSRDAPPFGLGLVPGHGTLTRLRDRLAPRVTVGTLQRIIAKHVNPVRVELGLKALRILEEFYLAAPLILSFTAEPFEYPRTDWPDTVRLVGPGLWEPPVEPPPWLDELRQPLVLVTCSTAFQNDIRLAELVCAAFADEPFDVVLTTGDLEVGVLQPPPNVRVVSFAPHSAMLARAACTVCHAGMGITQKALAFGVPVVAVPFGRDQPEVARRVEVSGAGVRLPARRLNPDRLRSAVLEAIGMRRGAERIARAFADAGGTPAAADALERLVA